MSEDDSATLEEQFFEFAKLLDNQRDGKTITLYRSDYWMRQSKVLDDRTLTMTDTGLAWWKFRKTEMSYDEWCEFLTDICTDKEINKELVEIDLSNCGIPGSTQVIVPQYKDFFDTFKPKSMLFY